MSKEQKAKQFAIEAHNRTGCTYHDGLVEIHLTDVNNILLKFLRGPEVKAETYYSEHEIETMLCATWLHDVIEDCRVSYNDLHEKFGYWVAEVVYSVTDELGKNRKERAEKTYPKIAKLDMAILVKLADRYANTKFSKDLGSPMYAAYVKQWPLFKEVIGAVKFPANHPITYAWTLLETLY